MSIERIAGFIIRRRWLLIFVGLPLIIFIVFSPFIHTTVKNEQTALIQQPTASSKLVNLSNVTLSSYLFDHPQATILFENPRNTTLNNKINSFLSNSSNLKTLSSSLIVYTDVYPDATTKGLKLAAGKLTLIRFDGGNETKRWVIDSKTDLKKSFVKSFNAL